MFIPNLSFWFVKSTSPHGVCACCLLNVSRSAVVTCVPVVCGTDTISMCPAISIWVNWWNHVWFLISTPPPLPGRGRAANRRRNGTRPRFQHWVPLRDWCSVVTAPDLLAVVPDVGLDLPGYALKEADCRLGEVYGDHIHDNDGTHLDWEIALDREWQAL